ncbi:MAG: hypothetical protein D6785_13720 [Planctomycetota bacterium]|nr:MAG: hypothetical protein D6785_13720 [Planctomycetota bacterium]
MSVDDFVIQDMVNLLKTNHIFKDVPQEALEVIQKKARVVHLEAGEILVRQGDILNSLYIVLQGRLKYVRKDDEGQEKVLAEARRNQTIGESAILTGEPYFASVYAIRETYLAEIPGYVLFRMIKRYPKTMISISRAMANRLRRAIEETPQTTHVSTIGLVSLMGMEKGLDFAKKLEECLKAFGKVEVIGPKHIERVLGKDYVQAPRNSMEGLTLVKWLNMQERVFDFIIFLLDFEEEEWTRRALRQSDLILTLANFEDSPEISKEEAEYLYHQNHPLGSHRHLVLLHPERKEWPKGTEKWLENRNVEFHHHICWNCEEDFERLARILSGNSIGLVMGGGGARGLAHIGVAKALKELGIPVDMVFGCSMGAILGAQFAALWSPEKMIEVTKTYMKGGKGVLDYTLPIVSFLSGQRLSKTVKQLSDDRRIEDLWLPFFCNTVNLNTGEHEVHRRGELWLALRASSSLPALFPPVKIGDAWHIDGGIISNLPADSLKEIQKQGKIIAIDVSVYREFHFTAQSSPAISGWYLLLRKITPFVPTHDMPSIIDIINRSIELPSLHHRQKLFASNVMDLYLRPPIEKYTILEFEKMDEIVEVGYKYGLEELAKWKEKEGI